jgi:hypothetical protein
MRLSVEIAVGCCMALMLAGCPNKPGPGGPPGKPQACGGIAGIKCPDGLMCVDDPSDTCDPAHGGADCPGICKGK